MSDDELLKSLDTYACQLREVNAKLIYAAKARIEALRGEVARLTTERDKWQGKSNEQEDRADLLTAERDRLAGEVERLKAQVRFASETDPAMRAEAAEAERDRLAGEVERLKMLSVGTALETVAQKERAQKAEAERDRLKAESE